LEYVLVALHRDTSFQRGTEPKHPDTEPRLLVLKLPPLLLSGSSFFRGIDLTGDDMGGAAAKTGKA
jgi:hypothetical protein